MNILAFIWLTSLALAVTSLAIMAILIIVRQVTDHRARKYAAHERALIPLLLGEGEWPATAISGIPTAVLAGVSTRLIRLVRGGDREAFIARAARLGVPQRLARQLHSRSARTRLAAAEAIGAFHDPETHAALQRALDDSNDDVRLAAALSLAASGETHGAGEIARKLGLGSNEPSLLMLSLFGRIASDRPAEIKALASNPAAHPRVRVAAIEALARTGDYSLVPMIVALTRTAPDDSEELPRYLRALGELGHPAASEAVVEALSRPSMAARAAAAGAAGRIGLIDVAPKLAALLDDTEWWVRFRAAEALIRFGEPGCKLLREAAGSDNPRVRDAAETMLAERGVAR